MRQFRPMTAASMIVTIAAAACWCAALWGPLDPRAIIGAFAAAVTVTVGAVGCWLVAWLSGRAMLYLADAVVASRRAALTTTAPLRVLRAR